MPFFDMPLDELRSYRPTVAEPADFDDFWGATIQEARSAEGTLSLTPIDTGMTSFDSFDVTFPGYAGEPIRGWLTLPRNAEGPLPAIVTYVGYGRGRGLPHEQLAWAAAGYASFIMDTRGQGAGWGTGGQTPDPHGAAPSTPGFMTRGILDPDTYYYRRLITDAVRAVDAVRTIDAVDPARVIAAGTSQGGGIALAVAGLVPDLLALLSDVPFLNHFERAVGLTANQPYAEIALYLSVHRNAQDKVFRTLSYFDGVNFAKRAKAPGLFSAALMDQTCPPSTVFAAANVYAGKAETTVYEFNGHEGGEGYRWPEQHQWLSRLPSASLRV
ncbi:acetylxylan esterase [Pseudarthrobacter sp. NamE2]|uniref:acetylxylan esterase n=1 Tax=Pseudarthrobacter sp. NamE2 TaxID=2576838 RepID=UPI0010FE2597|nr:acetylxylan esterase [Pseudarthrobacter sp. NamE2]TLM83581.1 acetylxylan esterase [Pseudarthrobacter sp. NamE2]